MKYLIFLVLFSLSLQFKTKGIDLSKWNGKVDFQKVKNAGYTFVILKAGSGKTPKDPFFETNYEGARAAGLNIGAYWFSYAQVEDDGIKEANGMLKAIEGKKFEYPIIYDIEGEVFKRKIASQISVKFCDFIQEKNYHCGLYASRSHLNTYFSKEVRERYDIWVAEYASKCTYKSKYKMWQNSSKGNVPGVKGDCDTDFSYFDYPAFIKENHLNGY